MDEYPLHEEYYKSVRGEDGEKPLKALGSPPYTDMGSCPYSGPTNGPGRHCVSTAATERASMASRAANY